MKQVAPILRLVDSAATRSRIAEQTARLEALDAVDQALGRLSAQTPELKEISRLGLVPAGVRDRIERLAAILEGEVQAIALLNERLGGQK